jgi:hypothetical protein
VTLPTTTSRIGEPTMRRMRDYALEEPSFTAAFMAWELGLSAGVAHAGVKRLLAAGLIEQIEPRSGPYAAVYVAVPKRRRPAATLHVVTAGTAPRELDGREVAYTTEAAREVA